MRIFLMYVQSSKFRQQHFIKDLFELFNLVKIKRKHFFKLLKPKLKRTFWRWKNLLSAAAIFVLELRPNIQGTLEHSKMSYRYGTQK